MSNEVAAEETPDLILEEKPIPGFVRVDLLPQEIIEKEAIRKARNFAVILLVVALFIIVIWRRRVLFLFDMLHVLNLKTNSSWLPTSLVVVSILRSKKVQVFLL